MSLDLFASVCQDCGTEIVGGPGLCVPCAMVANGGVLPCSACDGDGCEPCAFSGEAASVGWDYTTWPEGEVRGLGGVAVVEESPLQSLLSKREGNDEAR